jgi:primase-polymerase (primpol)-like protein
MDVSIVSYLKSFPQQFILYRPQPSASRPGKTDKFPCSYLTGEVVSAHDCQHWTDADTARDAATSRGAGFGIGYVFTENDPLFFIDIDNCKLGDGTPESPYTWSPLAVSLCQLFSGAYIEVSQSGTGLHIIGTGKPPTHSCRNQAYGLEFYHAGRFVALTGNNTVGDASADMSHVLAPFVAAYFPPDTSAADDGQDWSTGPVAEWSGPSDDDELIRRAMNSKSAAGTFGGKASFTDLWKANAEALGRAYPDTGGRSYDASAADAALAQHLAWWSGKDPERIERIMRRSALARDKWDEREDYLPRTIRITIARQESVFSDKGRSGAVEAAQRRQEQLEENMRVGDGADVLPLAGEINLEEMLRRFAAITEGRQVVDMDNPRRIFNEEDWAASLAASRTLMEVEGSKPKSYATTKLWKEHQRRQQVDTVTFRPGGQLLTRNPDNVAAVNTWRHFVRTPAAASHQLFVDQIGYLWGGQADHALNWLAHLEQRPGELPHTGLLHISTAQGTGRNWIASVLCRIWAGHVAASFDLAGSLRDGFNGALSRKLLAIVDEINEGGSNVQWQNAEKLKSMMTTERREINPKFGRRTVEFNVCRLLVFSNHISALPLTESDRRFHVYRNDLAPKASNYYVALYEALKDREFINSVAQHLKSRDISHYNPNERPEMTDAKRELIAASRSEADDILAKVVSVWPSDVISNSALGVLVTGEPAGKLGSAHRHALERARIRKRETPIKIGPTTSRVSILRNHEVWESADAEMIRAELAKSPRLEFNDPRACLDGLLTVIDR